jgi:hypothetical protein
MTFCSDVQSKYKNIVCFQYVEFIFISFIGKVTEDIMEASPKEPGLAWPGLAWPSLA